jgi:hypothetical protein
VFHDDIRIIDHVIIVHEYIEGTMMIQVVNGNISRGVIIHDIVVPVMMYSQFVIHHDIDEIQVVVIQLIHEFVEGTIFQLVHNNISGDSIVHVIRNHDIVVILPVVSIEFIHDEYVFHHVNCCIAHVIIIFHDISIGVFPVIIDQEFVLPPVVFCIFNQVYISIKLRAWGVQNRSPGLAIVGESVL